MAAERAVGRAARGREDPRDDARRLVSLAAVRARGVQRPPGAARGQDDVLGTGVAVRLPALLRAQAVAALPAARRPNAPPARPPVLRHLAAALDAAEHGPLAALVPPLRRLAPTMTWSSYGRACDGTACDGTACDGTACDGTACDGTASSGLAGPGPTLAEVVAWTTVVGPAPDGGTGSPAAHLVADDLCLGVLLQAPSSHYPLHSHPAAERYVVLAGTARARVGGREDVLAPGTVSTRGPHEPHDSTTPAAALLVLWTWHGDVTSPSRLLPAAPGTASSRGREPTTGAPPRTGAFSRTGVSPGKEASRGTGAFPSAGRGDPHSVRSRREPP